MDEKSHKCAQSIDGGLTEIPTQSLKDILNKEF